MEIVSGPRAIREEGSMRLSMARSYGTSATRVEGLKRMFAHLRVLIMALMTAGPVLAQAQVPATAPGKPVKMVVLGDSLSAGLGLSASAAFPARLQKTFGDKGRKGDKIKHAGGGETLSGRP